MKKILYIAAASVALLFVACNDDFLTKTPETSLSPDTFFASEKEQELWTNRFYNLFDSADGSTEGAMQSSDDKINMSVGSLILGTRSAATESWSWTYLRYINYFLERSDNCTDEAVRTKYEGVAYFFRALFYYQKVRKYGDVPWYDHVIESNNQDDLRRPRDDRSTVMRNVIADLDRAAEMLPAAWSSDAVYRVNRYAALALKSRVALFEGTFRKYHNLGDYEYFLTQSADAAQKVIESGKYSLYSKGSTPYRDLFMLEDADTKESILSIRYNADLLVRHGIQFTLRNMRHGATRRFMNHYLMVDGSTFESKEGWQTMSYTDECSGRDPRLAQTILTPGYIQAGETELSANDLTALTGYRFIKFVSDATHEGATTSTTDWSLFRYSEVLLNYAEAKAELGTLTQDDVDKTVAVIRTRAWAGSGTAAPKLDMVAANSAPDSYLESCYPNVSATNKGVILEIRRERTVELVAEGLRQWDMLRWKEGAQIQPPYQGCYFAALGEYDMDGDGKNDLCLWSGSKPSTKCATSKEVGAGKDIVLSEGDHGYIVAFSDQAFTVWDESRDYLWPIPADQRVATGGALTQNPGWNDGTGL